MSDAREKAHFRRGLRAAQTEAETRLWYRLRDRRLAGFKFVRQESIGRFVADFCCREARLIVEVDGGQHADSEHDRLRDAWLSAQGYRVLRFWNAEVMTNATGVLETILAALPPSPRPKSGLPAFGFPVRIPGKPEMRRGEGRAPLVGGEASPKGDGEGVGRIDLSGEPPHPRLPPCSGDDKVAEALSPQAGRGGAVSMLGLYEGRRAALIPSPRPRGEGRAPLAGGEASPKGDGEGVGRIDLSGAPPHPRLPPRSGDDEVAEALSPQAGRGGEHA